jgi:hypothetical protein
MTDGSFDFYTLDTVASVDVYGISPAGHAFNARGSLTRRVNRRSGSIRTSAHQVALIPFSAVDSTATAEKDTGFDLPANAMVSPHIGIYVSALQSGKTIDFGTSPRRAVAMRTVSAWRSLSRPLGSVLAEVRFHRNPRCADRRRHPRPRVCGGGELPVGQLHPERGLDHG